MIAWIRRPGSTPDQIAERWADRRPWKTELADGYRWLWSRPTVIPDQLLGRVNSVYRFFGWGMMPIGAALGGLVVVVSDVFWSREFAQRMPWFVAGVLTIALFAYAGPRVTTAKFAEARAAALTDTGTGR